VAAPPARATGAGHAAAARRDRRAGGGEISILGEGPTGVGQAAATPGTEARPPVPAGRPIGVRHRGVRPGGRGSERAGGPAPTLECGAKELAASAARAAVHDRGRSRPAQPVRGRVCGHGHPLPTGGTELRRLRPARIPAPLNWPCARAGGTAARLVAPFPWRLHALPGALPALAPRRGRGADRVARAVRRLAAAGVASASRRVHAPRQRHAPKWWRVSSPCDAPRCRRVPRQRRGEGTGHGEETRRDDDTRRYVGTPGGEDAHGGEETHGGEDTHRGEDTCGARRRQPPWLRRPAPQPAPRPGARARAGPAWRR